MIVTNQNLNQEEITGSVCYHSGQNLLSSCLLAKNITIKLYKTKIFPMVLCGCEIGSMSLREKRRLDVFEDMWELPT
jgi:hypothetical protein